MQNTANKNNVGYPAFPIGNSNWPEVKAGYWSADKTQLISGILDKTDGLIVLKYGIGFSGKRVALAK